MCYKKILLTYLNEGRKFLPRKFLPQRYELIRKSFV